MRKAKNPLLSSPLVPLKFTEETGLAGAIIYLCPAAEVTEAHIRAAVDARILQKEEWENAPKVKGWKPEDHW